MFVEWKRWSSYTYIVQNIERGHIIILNFFEIFHCYMVDMSFETSSGIWIAWGWCRKNAGTDLTTFIFIFSAVLWVESFVASGLKLLKLAHIFKSINWLIHADFSCDVCTLNGMGASVVRTKNTGCELKHPRGINVQELTKSMAWDNRNVQAPRRRNAH